MWKEDWDKGYFFSFLSSLNAFIWFGGHTQGLLPALCLGGHVMLELKSDTPLGKTCILPITLSVQPSPLCLGEKEYQSLIRVLETQVKSVLEARKV